MDNLSNKATKHVKRFISGGIEPNSVQTKKLINKNLKYYEKMKYCTVSIVRNGFGKYVVTKWTDYEYQRYSEQIFFSDKDLAADYAWKLFGGDEEYKKFLDDKK